MQKASEGLNVEVFVVDNDSVDGSVQMVQSRFPDVKLIANKDNVGFSKANNQAIRLSNAEYILLLNPDTVLEEDCLRKCCDFMDAHPEAGGLGVKMLDGKGNFLPESKRGLPTPEVAFYKVFGLAAIFPKTKKFGRYHMGFLGEDDTNEVEVLAGAYMFMRSSVLDKIGLLDEDYFMYGEDIDLSYRIIKGGYKNYYFPETRIIHYKGESTKRTSVNYVFVFYRAMIIFAEKHFSHKSAGLFSFFINLAIYLRASIAVVTRFVQKMWLPALDFSVIYLIMRLITRFWEINVKFYAGFYPEIYLSVIIPIYIICWQSLIYFSGGYDKDFRFYKIIRGAAWGTLLISGASNFLEDYRFSRALMLIGFLVSTFSIFLIRLIGHFITHRDIRIGEAKTKRTLLVGDKEECERVRVMLDQVKAKVNVIGYLQTIETVCKDLWCLGHIRQLNEAIMIYDADEVIFCSKNMASTDIIEWMTKVRTTGVDFKIVPDESNYIIGSNSKESVGELYTFDVELDIAKPESVRSKRLLDITFSTYFLLTFPIQLVFVKNKLGALKNAFSVLFGYKTWVGFSVASSIQIAKIGSSVLNPTSGLDLHLLDEATTKRLDLLYAKEYKTMDDFLIILKNYPSLGN